MSALPRPCEPRLAPMTSADLEAVLAVERAAYAFPWTRGNFVDSLAAGYAASLLRDADEDLLGYSVAMSGVAELHLLNLTVAPAWQRRGFGSRLLEDLVGLCRGTGAQRLWLEVRAGNAAARRLYERRGFEQVGVRRGYYPASLGRREDAVVMQLPIGAGDALG